jgi:hypothetical protein
MIIFTVRCEGWAAAVDLTGYWLADDGCQYYISQAADKGWWAGLDNQGTLQDGLQVSTVFFGQIPLILHPPGTGIEDTIEGEWFDVPRASAMSSGQLSLRISLGTGEPVLFRTFASGRFRATQWHRSPRQVGSSELSWFDKPIHDADAEELFQLAIKNSGNPLLGDLKPFRPVVVAYGWTRSDDPDKGFRSPYVSQREEWGKGLSNFFDGNDDADRDANFDLSVDMSAWNAHLARSDLAWTLGRDPRVIDNKLKWDREHEGQGESRIHCEMTMFGVTSAGSGNKRIYPGWADSGGNSILVNGRPVNGNIGIGFPVEHIELDPADNKLVYVPDPYERFLTSIGGLRLGPDGTYIRVTGVLALDCGHAQFWPPEGSPCYDEHPESEQDSSAQNQEIHPVLAVDIITATPTANLSGVWGAENGDTIYLHQVDQKVMGLRMPPLGGMNGITVLQGLRVGNDIRGAWRRLSPPIQSGELLLVFGGTIISTTTPNEGNWRKLYDAVDQTPAIKITEVAFPQCDPRRPAEGREGGSISFTVNTSNFPSGSQLWYTWSADGLPLTGANSQTVIIDGLPAVGTPITVSVIVEDDTQSQYMAKHDFVVLAGLGSDEYQWLKLICLIKKIAGIPLPVPVPEPDVPMPLPVEAIERLRELRSSALAEIQRDLIAAERLAHELSIQPYALKGAPNMRTVFAISDVLCSAASVTSEETSLTVDFRVHDNGLAHVAGVVVTTDDWRNSRVVHAEFRGNGDGFEYWQAEFLAHEPSAIFECVVFCDDYGCDYDVPRVWETNGGHRYRVGVEDRRA